MLNETLYTTKGREAYALLQENPSLFTAYHEGFRAQTKGWNVNPVDMAVERAKKVRYGTVV